VRRISGHIRVRSIDPGGLYNIGNVLGFVTGFAVALSMDTSGGVTVAIWDRALSHVAGSPAGLALTAATAVFFWGGILYGKAWTGGTLTDPALNLWGDVLSGVGAIILGVGLLMICDPWLATSAGAMHALGKFGSALGSAAPSHLSLTSERTAVFGKDLVLMSRVPAVLAGAAALWQALVLTYSVQELLLALSFMACCIIWAVADWMLLSPRGWIRTTVASLFP
jgi:hypothetical protein